MNGREAVKALMDGKRVGCCSWSPGVHLYLNSGNILCTIGANKPVVWQEIVASKAEWELREDWKAPKW